MQPRSKPSQLVPFFRLVLSIGSDSYAVVPLATGPHQKAFRLRKLTGDRNSYEIRVRDNRARCTCRGFTRWGRCKHVRVLQAARMLDLQEAPRA